MRKAIYLSTAVSLLLLAACFSSSSGSASSEVEATTGPCGGITLAQAAVILHLAPADVNGPLPQQENNACVYRSRKVFWKQVFFTIYVEPSSAVAKQKLENWKEGFAVLSPVNAVDGLGDEAWHFPDHRVGRLLMRKDNVVLDVLQPHDKATQIQMAKIVLAHIH